MEKVDLMVVGGGVIGLAAASLLADSHEVFLIERRPFLGEEQSGRNSGVIHAGVYYHPASLKARFCVAGNSMLYRFCAEHGVPCARIGKFIVATTNKQIPHLLALYRRAKKIGARGVHIVTPQELHASQPNIHCKLALHFPSTGIIEASTYIKTLAKLVRSKGSTILTSTTLTHLQPHPHGVMVEITYKNGSSERLIARKMVNATGTSSADIAKKLNPALKLSISPTRGEYYSYIARDESLQIHTNIYPAPTLMSIGEEKRFVVGIHLTPTFEMLPDGTFKIGRRILVGPSAQTTNDPSDFSPPRLPPEHFVKAVRDFFPQLASEMLQPEYTGIQAKLANYNDFAIFRDPACPACVHAVGVDSPGLTASLAIAEFITRLLNS